MICLGDCNKSVEACLRDHGRPCELLKRAEKAEARVAELDGQLSLVLADAHTRGHYSPIHAKAELVLLGERTSPSVGDTKKENHGATDSNAARSIVPDGRGNPSVRDVGSHLREASQVNATSEAQRTFVPGDFVTTPHRKDSVVLGVVTKVDPGALDVSGFAVAGPRAARGSLEYVANWRVPITDHLVLLRSAPRTQEAMHHPECAWAPGENASLCSCAGRGPVYRNGQLPDGSWTECCDEPDCINPGTFVRLKCSAHHTDKALSATGADYCAGCGWINYGESHKSACLKTPGKRMDYPRPGDRVAHGEVMSVMIRVQVKRRDGTIGYYEPTEPGAQRSDSAPTPKGGGQ